MPASAIVLLVPELERFVRRWRERYDPSAQQGVGAHLTLLFPFKPVEEIRAEDLAGLAGLFAAERLPPLEFAGVCAFRNLVYLPPEPMSAVSALIEMLAGRFPQTPPYEGTIPLGQIVPHVSVAFAEDAAQQASLAVDVCRESATELPVRVQVREAVLLGQDDAGRYHARAVFPFQG